MGAKSPGNLAHPPINQARHGISQPLFYALFYEALLGGWENLRSF